MERKENQSRIIALGGSLLFHGLVILFFFLWVIKTPIPPYPDTGTPGLEVNLGLSEDGMGDLQPEEVGDESSSQVSEEVIVQPITNNQAPAFKSTEAILTQETEEAPATEAIKDKQEENPSPAKEKENPNPPKKVNAKALFPGSKGSKKGGNEGETGKPGDQGDPNGSRDSKYHGPGGGSGDTPGGDGNGNDKGVSFSLLNRKPQALIPPKSNIQEEGKVVVEITVDKRGVVIFAKAGARGSTTSNSALLEIARKAALGVRFNADPDADEEQKGKITYNFTLR